MAAYLKSWNVCTFADHTYRNNPFAGAVSESLNPISDLFDTSYDYDQRSGL